MKKKLLLLSALVLNVFGAMAQITWMDYTSKITNPSFETGTPLSDPKTGYSTTCDGWTVTPASASNSQVGIVASSATIQGVATSVTTSDGGNYFYIRNNWNNDTNYNISQTIASSSTLPVGYYKLSLKAITYAGNWSTCAHTVAIQEGDNVASVKTLYSTGATWTDFTVLVYKKSADTDLKISANLKAGSSGGGQHYQLLIDDVKLQYCESLGATASAPVEVTDYISNPTIQNTNKTYVPRGWTAGSRTVGNSNYTEGTGDTRLEAWSGGNMNFDYYQTLNGLKDGNYRLVATCGDSNDKGGYLYATSSEVTATADMPASAEEINTQIAVVNNTLTIGIKTETTSGGSWMTGDNFKLYYLGEGIDLTDWNNAKAAAQAELDKYDEKYAATERQAVVDAKNAADPTSATQMADMVSDLSSKVAAYKVKAANEKLMDEKSALTTFINTTLSATYPNSSDEVLNTDISKWTSSTYVVMNAGEHWSGVNPSKYYEQSSAQWGQNSWSIAAEETVNLPAGKYAFVVTARAAAETTSKMTVNGTEVELSHVGSAGYGIATNGEATYDMSKTYANTVGRGWEYAYVEFELTESKDVTFKLESSTSTVHNWVSIANPVLYYNDAAKTNMENVVKQAILDQIAAIEVPNAPMNATVKLTLDTKKVAADAASLTNTQDELNTIKSELIAAIADANASIAIYENINAYYQMTSAKVSGVYSSYTTDYEAGKYATEAEGIAAIKADRNTAATTSMEAGKDLTALIDNPGFELGNTNYWSVIGSSDTGARDANNDTYKMTGSEGSYLFNTWWQGTPLTQNLGKLPAGAYELTATIASDGGTIYMTVNGSSVGYIETMDKAVGITGNSAFTLNEETEVTIGVVGGGQGTAGQHKEYSENGYWFYKVDNFQLKYLGATAPVNTIGGEYVLSLGDDFVNRGGDSNTEAVMAEAGLPVTVNEVSAGISTIQFQDNNGYMMWNGEMVYTDGTMEPKKTTHLSYWKITPVEGGYTLLNTQSGKYLSTTTRDELTVVTLSENPAVWTLGDANEAKLNLALAELASALEDAVSIDEDLVGEDPFLYNQDEYDEYDEVLTLANMYMLGMYGEITLEGVQEQIAAVKNAALPTLNAPEEGVLFHLALVDYNEAKGVDNVVTFKDGNASAGGYAIGYTEAAGSYLTQAVTFTKKEGNVFYMSVNDKDGGVHYVCSGESYNGTRQQLRMISNVEQALGIEVIPVSEGVWNLKNTYADALIGSNGSEGFYTANTYVQFAITEAEPVSVAKTIREGNAYGTCILPFAVASDDMGEMLAYTAEVDGNTIVLTQSSGMEACKPYIIENKAGTYNFSGHSVAAKSEYTDNVMTGVLTSTQVPANAYVLQNQTGVQGFYKVTTEDVYCGAYKAYLNADGSEVKAFYFNQADAINAIEALTSGEAKIYDINGRQQKSLQKGINIVNGVKVLVK